MIEQILLHLWGDYITQTDKMAENKTKSSYYCFLHALTYSLPFLLITQSPLALFVIFGSHFIIDRFRLARYVIYYKNRLHDKSITWERCVKTGYDESRPEWLAVWLMIIADNTLHLTFNYIAVTYL